MKVDLAKFQGSLPYASELYGVYQPLLGWRSRRMVRRFHPAGSALFRDLAQTLVAKTRPDFSLDTQRDPREPGGFVLAPGTQGPSLPTVLPSFLDSAVGTVLADRLRQTGTSDPAVWDRLLGPDGMVELLQEAESKVRSTLMQESRAGIALSAVLARESAVAGSLAELHRNGRTDVLHALFTAGANVLDMAAIGALQSWLGAASDDPRSKPDATLSPIGIVHIFRQYFFEFDTFLGVPVQHVWLSPGSTVELVEISTRHTLTERTTESTFETIQKSEKSETLQDELSDAVKEENQNTSKFGVSVDSTSNLNLGTFTTQLTAKTTYDSEDVRKTAKEQTHKQLRQQTTKLSSEIKKSFKSTFRTVVETTDSSSKRYLLQNTTAELVNYELRRKMRQVGVQVQDVGTQLCWQAYVDNAGDQLGVAKLIHIGQPPETNVQPAQLIPAPEPYTDTVNGSFVGPDDDDYNRDLGGVIHLFPKHGYEYAGSSEVLWPSGNAADELKITQDPADGNVLDLHVRGSTEDENPTIAYRFTVHFKPTDGYLAEIKNENDNRIKAVDLEKERLAKEAFFKAAHDRVKAASNIQQRRFEELREEERIIVYRGLIRQLFRGIGLSTNDHRAHHLAAELVQSMFDVDKMLYFVAPEWWVPRPQSSAPHPSPQGAIPADKQAEFDQINTVAWGGAEDRPDNYYITDDSTPARLGSSLGWLLQLDGDNLRNAFLNAPWVKAVIPIRPGREMSALDWLTNAGVEGSDGLDDLYQEAIPGERARMLATLKGHSWDDAALNSRYASIGSTDITLHDAIRYLAVIVADEHEKSRVKVSDTLPDATPVNYLPPDKVFERGFDPLSGGFEVGGKSFDVFDQWIEILPTDQIVAVEVHYDPKTGMQK